MHARGIKIALALAAGLSLAYGVHGALADSAAHDGPLWDVEYYRTAAANWHAGADPYLAGGSQTGYYYPPSVTPLLARVFLGFEAEIPYVLLMAAAIAAALSLSIRAVGPPPGTVALCWLYAVAFGNAEVVYLLASGNLAWLTGLLQAAALFAASRRRWIWFYALVGCAALVKPYSIVLLVVPFALGALSRWTVLAVVPPLLEALVSRVVWPGLAERRMEAIWLGVIEPLQLRYSLAGRLSRLLAKLEMDVAAATVVAVGIQLALAGLLALVLWRRRPADERMAFALAVVAALAAFPRMAGYDALVFGPAAFVACWTCVAARRSPGAAVAGALALLAGLLKEGLAVLPLLALAVVLLVRRRRAHVSRRFR